MVFDKLFEFFAILFELRCHVIWIIGSSRDRLGSPLRFVQHHLVA
jgi:hypothetical protein